MNSPSTTAFNNQAIRWAICSFIGDCDIWKSKFDEVIQQCMWKIKFRKEVVIQFKKGARLVAFDEEGICPNCYHYGDQEYSGSLRGRCMNHYGHEDEDMVWTCFDDYKNISTFSIYETYEEYEKERLEEYEEERRREHELYALSLDRLNI